ncbi:MAG: RNA polymerase sigma factor [Ignavibacteriales bacterium]|nr:RNA polymerase sigma factor [Ignavibacteriales bacterium]
MTAADERQLILQVKEGNHGAFRVLVERYMKHAYNIAYGFVNDHDDAEDIAQESFVRIYDSIKTFRGDAAFNTWLYRIVMNISLNRLRRKKNMNRTKLSSFQNMMLTADSGYAMVSQNETKEIMEQKLHELPTLQRAVVILRHLNGLSTKQVSGILRCSEGTVKTHLHRGLKNLRSKMSYLKSEVL